ncbi:MAG: EB domain-containing protein [Myxococcota bacterium]
MRALLLLSTSLACTTSTPSAGTDGGVVSDAGPLPDAGAPDAGPTGAAGYCERTVEMFCGFYLRCGRMAVDSLEECRAVFRETCNGRYEPRYVMLEEASLLTLSPSGIMACEAHLATVSCEQQIRDLDGPCQGLWVGTQPAGAPCGFDVESLVCAPGTACVLSLTLCGTCRTAAEPGQACGGEITCGADSSCEGGTCVRRALPGETCANGERCVVGATCTEGVCRGPSYVGVGESCNQTARCAYKSVCTQGTCREAALVDEDCGNGTACASGYCRSGVCAALLPVGETCTGPDQCASASCVEGTCAPIPGVCFQADGGSP